MSTSQVSTTQVSAVAARSAATMRKLAAKNTELEAENTQLREKVASYERGDRVRSIATQMEDKGLNADMTFEEKVASLVGYSDLDKVEEAVKMASSGNLQLASVTTDDDNVRGQASNAAGGFMSFCATGESNT